MHFEPVIKLEQVQTRTLEEDEATIFKMYSHIHIYRIQIIYLLYYFLL